MAAETSRPAHDVATQLARYPLLEALYGRRSRRFGLGMKIEHGPFAYTSRQAPLPLSEDEDAALAFAAAGTTGPALADLAYGPGQGGSMLLGLAGRTVASADAINSVAVVLANDEGSYLVHRPQDMAPADRAALVDLGRQGALAEWYRRARVKLGEGRAAPPVVPGFNFNLNRWSLYAPGGTYLLPINDVTTLYVNALLESFDETMGLFVVDKRALFRPAGLSRFARTKGGHLEDDPRAGRLLTIQGLETALLEAVAIEQGMMLQNVGLAAQALGLGGFPNFAPHPYSWFQVLGFRMGAMPGSRYLGANRLLSAALGLLGRDPPLPYPLGLERGGEVLLKPLCPPYYPTMAAAVRALEQQKYGPAGTFRGGAGSGGWREPEQVAARVPGPSERAAAATIAYCEYIYGRYGRFPAYSAPFRTVMGYQATHVDVEFYDRFYQPQALTDTQREHLSRWHGNAT